MSRASHRLKLPTAGVCLAMAILSGCSTSGAGGDVDASTDAAALEQRRLDHLWEEVANLYPEAERPPTPVVVEITSQAGWAAKQAQCMSDVGYPVEARRDGGLSYGAVMTQDLEFHLARYTCEARFPPSPESLLPPSEADLEASYRYATGPLTDCLKQRGYDVPEPPSLKTYIEQQRSGVGDMWMAYGGIDEQISEEDWLDLNEACPQVPANP